LLGRAKFAADGFEYDSRGLGSYFQRRHVGIESAQLALHNQRSRLVGAAAGDHAPLVAGAIRREESKLRIVTRELLGGARAVGQIGGAQPGQKLLGRGAQGIAKLHQLVESRHYAFIRAEVHDRFVHVEAQISQ